MSVRVSFLLFAYNHERFIEEALRAALAQTCSSMEIIISDDGSSDGTAALIEDILATHDGLMPVRFIRNDQNGGLASALNKAASLAKGEILVAAAGDDRSAPDRASRLVESYDADPSIFCVFSNAHVVDEVGVRMRLHYSSPPKDKTLLAFAGPRTGLLGATASYRKEVFRDFDPLTPDLLSEDWVLPLRAAILGRVVFEDRPLVDYRVHSSNLSMALQPQATHLQGWIAKERMGIDRAISILINRLADLQTGLRLMPGRRDELIRVRKATQVFLMRAKAERQLLDGCGPVQGLKLTAKILANNGNRHVAWRWLQLAFPYIGFRRSLRSAK